ncbi:Hypothetical predicted protein [Olea europaea subsp. europaea]|uniref:Uncharacterized protein n=1 Tax=Olea europaea subsp. europaea TaxID=158383 RepID=A0A8S0R605_OLEEU|nr:Hypothetical predicted protein [Olea europaea subsp. europaea]
MGKRVCINECPEMEVEDEMDSENNRRILVIRKKYISYDTLKRDSVPCTQPGASYYNCKGPGVANTYHRDEYCRPVSKRPAISRGTGLVLRPTYDRFG